MQNVLPMNARTVDSALHARLSYESLKTLPVEELVQKCQAGDECALDELMRRYKGCIYHWARRLTTNSMDAEDVAAETFFCICRGIGTFKASMALPAWISRIVKNVWFDIQRRAQRHPTVALDALEERAIDRCLYAAEIKEEMAPQRRVEQNERSALINDAIRSLPSFQRRIVRLFYVEGQTYEEIAEMMDIPVGTVKSRLNRARYALREKLEPQFQTLMN